LEPTEFLPDRPRVCAVSYLNTVPLVWGLLHDPPLQNIFDLDFAVPSECADQLASGQADIGILPVIEMARQRLDFFRGSGIASFGPVRSILLISKVPFAQIRTLATDSGSRTSVMLARVTLAEKFGATPSLISLAPDLTTMLGVADAALLIGDAALHVNPAALPFQTLDLGQEWTALTGLPMVFAVWAGRRGSLRQEYGDALLASCRFGILRRDEIVRQEAPRRALAESLVREYLTRHIVFELGEREYAGLDLFLQRATTFDPAVVPGGVCV
jgi:chorismate dehydratase